MVKNVKFCCLLCPKIATFKRKYKVHLPWDNWICFAKKHGLDVNELIAAKIESTLVALNEADKQAEAMEEAQQKETNVSKNDETNINPKTTRSVGVRTKESPYMFSSFLKADH